MCREESNRENKKPYEAVKTKGTKIEQYVFQEKERKTKRRKKKRGKEDVKSVTGYKVIDGGT